MKHLPILILFALLLIACEEDNTDDPERASPFVIVRESSSFTVEQNRLVLSVRDGFDFSSSATAMQVRARDFDAEGEPIVWEGTATEYEDFELPYWVVYPEINRAGNWIFEVTYTVEDGQTWDTSVALTVNDASFGLTSGDEAFPSESRTWDGVSDIRDITSDGDPNEAYYAQTIAEAISSGRPTLVAFSTPGFCQTDTCAPVMTTVDALWETYQDSMNFIHIEVHDDFEALTYVETYSEWGLQNEPWIYLIAADGIIEARYDGPVAVSEIAPVIEAMIDAS